ncbi:MAG: sigma-70 family RNA polymerase sigma factor [Pseudomonadota bacterium]
MTGSGEPPSEAAQEEAKLVARIAARDPEALRIAIGQHATLLHRIAYRMIGDAHEAEDIAQEAMLRLWDHAPRLDARVKQGTRVQLGAWLKRVTTNLAIDRIRVAKRSADSEVPERADDAPLADAQLVTSEDGHSARALIAQMPERQRAAIVLTYYEELPNAEAADALDMNIKAFESLLHRARGALRKAFEALETEGSAA